MLPPLVFALFLVGGDDTVCVDIGLLFFVVCLVVGIMRAGDNVLWCSLHVRGTSIPTRIDAAMINLALEEEFPIVPSVVSKIEISARFDGHCTKMALQHCKRSQSEYKEFQRSPQTIKNLTAVL